MNKDQTRRLMYLGGILMKPKVILGFSGGLDTSYCVKWLQEHDYEPVCVTLDIGQEADIGNVKQRALELGVTDIRIIDGIADFANYFLTPALKANALYQGVYPLATALSRPFVGKVLVDVATEVGTHFLAHGCTGKGNDQVRIELAIKALMPEAQIIDPIRDENLSRDEEMQYLEQRGIYTGITEAKPYSIDQNIWGRSICSGVLEDIWTEPPEEVFEWTQAVEQCPNTPEELEFEFESGVPVALNQQHMTLTEMITTLNDIGGKHGVGRIDHIEDRVVGIKSREIYEAPAATILIKAHQALETITLTGSSLAFKKLIEEEYAKLIYEGGWFSHHHMDLVAYLQHNQRKVSGTILMKLYKGHCIATGRASDFSLYRKELATYTSESLYDQRAATGFIHIFGMEHAVQAQAQMFNFTDETKLLTGTTE
jgi:argininosuccinate synthase